MGFWYTLGIHFGVDKGDWYTVGTGIHMKTKPKVQKAYRLMERTVKLIEVLAGKEGFSAQAAVIDMWAEEWVGRKENETPAWWDDEKVVEKKSGAARGAVVQDEPDELPPVVKKKLGALPVGVTTGAKLGAPKKKEEHVMELDGKIPAREKTLAELRANAQPFDRARQIKK